MAGQAAPRFVRDPLAPVPQASPRETFESFRVLTRSAETALLRAIALARGNHAIFDTAEMTRLRQKAMDDLVKASSLLDLRAVPPANRRSVGVSSVLLLEETFDRIDLPAAQDVPGRDAVAKGVLTHGWVLPGTELRIAPVQGADGRTRFFFSKGTVARLAEFYDRVRQLPRRDASRIDFYRSFILGPGFSMPIAVYRYVLRLPPWMLVSFHQQALWQWLAFAGASLCLLLVAGLLLRWAGRYRRPGFGVGRALLPMLPPLAIVTLLAVYRWFAQDVINLTGHVLATLELSVVVLQALGLAAAAVFAFNAIATLVVSMPRIQKESLDASLIRLILRVVGIIVAGYILSRAATHIGVPLYGIVASIGVGGLALALAIRPTLENFIGGVILYADRPVKVGDFCKFGDMLGTVESIGLRSTKIRGLDRTLITVQNSEFAQMSLVNYSRRDSNLMQAMIGVSYETPSERLPLVVEAIAAKLRGDERVDAQTVRVCLRSFGAYAIDIEIWAYVRCADWGLFLKIQEDLYMQIIAVMRQAEVTFAIPAQTTYLGRMRGPFEEMMPEREAAD